MWLSSVSLSRHCDPVLRGGSAAPPGQASYQGDSAFWVRTHIVTELNKI